MKLDTLDALGDVDLQAIAARCEALLKQHDTERKEKALEQARTLLASVGLSLKDVAKAPKAKGPVYHSGRQYAHPTNKALLWSGKGKKPTWLTVLEAEGGKAVEVANDNVTPGKAANDGALRKTG
jgi:DNA-binding protein H-NS